MATLRGPNDLSEWSWEDGVVDWESAEGAGTTTYTYDPVYPRVTGRSLSDGTEATRDTTYAYDALGRLSEATVSDGSQAVVTAWDDRDAYGRPRQVTRRVDGVLESSRVVTTDPRGRVSTLQLATPTRSAGASYQYYDNGQLYSVEAGWSGGGSASLTWARTDSDLSLATIRDNGSELNGAARQGARRGAPLATIGDNGSGLYVATSAVRDDLSRTMQVDLGMRSPRWAPPERRPLPRRSPRLRRRLTPATIRRAACRGALAPGARPEVSGSEQWRCRDDWRSCEGISPGRPRPTEREFRRDCPVGRRRPPRWWRAPGQLEHRLWQDWHREPGPRRHP